MSKVVKKKSKRITIAELEKSTSSRFAQMYEIIESLDSTIQLHEIRLTRCNDRVNKLEEEIEKLTGTAILIFGIFSIALVLLVGRIF